MNAKKIVVIIVVVFLGFWMISDPRGLADTASALVVAGWALATQLFTGLIRFFGSL